MPNDPQVPCDPQVPWTDEQWARVNQVVQEEASRARVAATFLPLIGPLPGDTDFVRAENIVPAASILPAVAPLTILDTNTIQLATLQVMVRVRGAQMADPEMTSVLALFRRAANLLARLEDAVVFRGLVPDPANPGGFRPPIALGPSLPPVPPAVLPGRVWQITNGQQMAGLWGRGHPFVHIPLWPTTGRDTRLVRGIAEAIGRLEAEGHFGPFAAALDQRLFLIAETPSPALVQPQDRIIPFLGGGPLLRSSTLDTPFPFIMSGVVVALGGSPVELVVATDVCLQFLQVTIDPAFFFRVFEKMTLRIKEPRAIMQLEMW